MSRENLLGKCIWDLFPETVGSPFYVEVHRAAAEQRIVHFEYFYSSWQRWFENHIYPSATGVSVLVTEITDRKRVQEKLGRTNQTLQTLIIYPIDLVTIVESALETVRLAAEAKHIQIQTVATLDNGQVAGDSARLQQIVWNLLSNAVKFTPDGGKVEIRLDQIGTYAQIQVRDTGKGISPDFLPYVFDCFRQEDGKITRKFGGLVLGLAIVRHLTELHGGTVHADSLGEGQGATFRVRLPLMAVAAASDREISMTAQSVDLSQLRILVVDDEEDMRDLVQVILEQQGAQVTVATSAAEALMLFDRQPPDILISDIGMPDMDGYMLMQQIRQRSSQQGGLIHAIALTAYAGEYDQRQALKVGFQKHISKPVEPEALVNAISELMVSGTSQ